ncbi:MAG: peptidase M28 family protein, partial [Verrucomicrobiota bacterium]
MRLLPLCCALLGLGTVARSQPAPPPPDPAAATVNRFFTEALAHGQAQAQLRDLTRRYPGRLSGSPALAGAVGWSQQVLAGLGL